MQTIQEFRMDVIEDVVEVPLTHGQVAIIDREDWERVRGYNWCAVYKDTRSYYAVTHQQIHGKRRKIQMHRLILDAPKEMQVDHINHNTLDNRKSNLRLCTPYQNQYNSRKQRNNTSGFKGIYKNKNGLRWIAKIQFCGKGQYLGTFDTREEAHAAYCEAALRLHGEFSNFGNDGYDEVQHLPDSRSNPEILWDARKPISNTSGYKGVSKDGNKWQAQIKFCLKRYYLGHFNDAKSASQVYQKAAAIRQSLGPKASHAEFEAAIEPIFKSRNKWQAQIDFCGKRYCLGRFDNPKSARQVYEQAAAIRQSLGPQASHVEFEAAIAPLKALREPARSGHDRKDAEREQVPCEV